MEKLNKDGSIIVLSLNSVSFPQRSEEADTGVERSIHVFS